LYGGVERLGAPVCDRLWALAFRVALVVSFGFDIAGLFTIFKPIKNRRAGGGADGAPVFNRLWAYVLRVGFTFYSVADSAGGRVI
jgi:hypothetical protein